MSRVVDDSSAASTNSSPARLLPHSYQHQHDANSSTFMEEENDDVLHSRGRHRHHTLGHLLERVGDARKEATGDETPVHQHSLQIGGGGGNGNDHLDLVVRNPSSQAVPFVLSFSNLTYSVKIRPKLSFATLFHRHNNSVTPPPINPNTQNGNLFSRSTKTLLNDISGSARDGEIMAVMGASGSGKSTLIDALANRISRESLKGTITLNDEPVESRLLKVISAYVMQDDLLFPMLTVEETLTYAAEFRLPRTLSASKKRARVAQLIDQLGLRNAAKTVIGDEGHRGVSGGERRRVSIGIDIVHDPILLFLDEPTSGLDSTSAFMVVKVLQRIAESGSVVVMTVHQPSYRILGLLNRLIFLSKGQMVYSGPPGNLPGFFAEFGRPIPENENRTEFALDLIRGLEQSPGGTKGLVEFNNKWQSSLKNVNNNNNNQLQTDHAPELPSGRLSLKEAISAAISRGKLVSGAGNGATAATAHVSAGSSSSSSLVPNFANPFYIEIGVLSRRSVTNSRRMPELFGIRMGAVLVTGFILATMFWQLDNSPKGVQERLGFFAFAMSTTFYTCADALPVFLQERYIFLRETAHNAYRRSSYVLSHALTSLPGIVILALSFAACTFWAVGLAGGVDGFLFYFAIIFASFWAGNSFVSFLSGVVPHVMLGYTIVVAILAYFLLFSGFFINRDRIPSYWIWFHYISLVKYPYEGVLINEFGDPKKCFVRGIQMFDNTPLAVVPNVMKVRLLRTLSSSLGVPITPTTCVTTGADILAQQGVTDLTKWNCLWITVAWGFFFRFLFYLALLLGSRNKRR